MVMGEDDDEQLQDLDANIALSAELHAASQAGDLGKCKELVERGALAWVQDDIGWSALHFAANARNPQLVQYLLRHGAVWNLVDNLGFTAGDIAYSLNDKEIYRIIVMEGVRAEMLKAVLEAQSASDDDEDEEADMDKEEEEAVELVEEEEKTAQAGPSTASNNKAFLSSRLRFEGSAETSDERCIDPEGNGVMMGWELPIMVETARLLCSNREDLEDDGLSVLNVGFGLGLVDQELQKYKPKRHVIIEPHPDVLQYARSKGWYDKEGVEFYQGTWQDYLKAFEAGEVQAEFDAIYFDTFSEHYKDLHSFFDSLPNLLKDDSSLFSFFHGLGATSQTFYDVYTEVSEMHLREIGLSTKWYEVSMLDKGEVTWEGISRRYWNIPGVYRLPICKLDF